MESKKVEKKFWWLEQQDANWIFVAVHHPLFEEYNNVPNWNFASNAHVLDYETPKPIFPLHIILMVPEVMTVMGYVRRCFGFYTYDNWKLNHMK